MTSQGRHDVSTRCHAECVCGITIKKHQRSTLLVLVWVLYRWNPLTNGQWCGKLFHVMTSLCCCLLLLVTVLGVYSWNRVLVNTSCPRYIYILDTYHYGDVKMGSIASQITSLTIVYSTVYSDADQRKHQSSASLAFARGIYRYRWIPRTEGQ